MHRSLRRPTTLALAAGLLTGVIGATPTAAGFAPGTWTVEGLGQALPIKGDYLVDGPAYANVFAVSLRPRFDDPVEAGLGALEMDNALSQLVTWGDAPEGFSISGSCGSDGAFCTAAEHSLWVGGHGLGQLAVDAGLGDRDGTIDLVIMKTSPDRAADAAQLLLASVGDTVTTRAKALPSWSATLKKALSQAAKGVEADLATAAKDGSGALGAIQANLLQYEVLLATGHETSETAVVALQNTLRDAIVSGLRAQLAASFSAADLATIFGSPFDVAAAGVKARDFVSVSANGHQGAVVTLRYTRGNQDGLHQCDDPAVPAGYDCVITTIEGSTARALGDSRFDPAANPIGRAVVSRGDLPGGTRPVVNPLMANAYSYKEANDYGCMNFFGSDICRDGALIESAPFTIPATVPTGRYASAVVDSHLTWRYGAQGYWVTGVNLWTGGTARVCDVTNPAMPVVPGTTSTLCTNTPIGAPLGWSTQASVSGLGVIPWNTTREGSINGTPSFKVTPGHTYSVFYWIAVKDQSWQANAHTTWDTELILDMGVARVTWPTR